MAKRVKLSQTMVKVLAKMGEAAGWQSAYELRTKFGTLYALQDRGLVERDAMRPGDIFFPHTSINWRITAKGRELLEEMKEKVNGQ